MEKVKELNLMDNKKLIILLNIVSFVIIIPMIVLFFAVAYWVAGPDSFGSPTDSLLTLIFTLIAIIFIHELIHGLFFKLFNPKGKVKFGFKKGMAYATSPGSFYTKKQFYTIALAPFVIITLILILGLALGVIGSPFFMVIASLHGSACTGDFYMSIYLMRQNKDVYVEDTEAGLNIYRKV